MPIDIPSKPQFNPHEDILKDNPVPSFEKDLLTNGFKRWINNSSFQVYADSDVLYGGTKDEVLIQGANPYKTSFTKNDIKISMYICSDGALLLDMYRNKKSLNLKEIHVFLEINDKHNIGGSVMLVKASSDVTKDKNTIPFADILRTAEGKKVNLSSGLIKNLINKEVLKQENKGFFLFHLIKAILNAKEVLETIALESVGYVFEDLLPNFIERFKIDESVWNPNHTDYKGHLIQTLGLDKEVPKLPEKEIQRIKSKIFNYFDSIIDDGQKNGDAFIALLEENKIFSKGLYLKIKNSWEKLQNIILSVRKRIAQIIEVYWEVLKMVPQMVVAYLCGLVNAVLDALIGLLELIGMLCYTAAYVKDLDNTKVRYIVEQIENLLEMKSKLDIGAYFDLLIEKGQSFLRSVWGQIKNGDISKIKLNKFIPVAYFCGYFIGWVVSIFLEAFFTGGIAAVENIVANIGSLGSRMLRGVKRVGEMGEEALEKFIT
ncbi:MAG: hypothetical protein JNL75_10840, partial [Chitinophagales bacterium]|nr:hypothetical protein [Chitinophagales bacterium]